MAAKTKYLYLIVGSRWYSEKECHSVARALQIDRPEALRSGAWGINLARAVDPKRELTKIVDSFDNEEERDDDKSV